MKKIGVISRFTAKAIGLFFPGTALTFLRNKQLLKNYTAAKPTGNDKAWRPTNKSADAILEGDRSLLLARARDLERNSSHISGAINKICNNVVFTGINPQSKIISTKGLSKKRINKKIETDFKEWAEDLDVNFYDMQELVLRHLWLDGEVLIHRFFDKALLAKGLCPFNIEILECDFLVSTMNRTRKNGNEIKSGIEYNKRKKPVAYHLYNNHPGGVSFFDTYFYGTRRIPAKDIRHVFFRRRASQSRGVSWLASIIVEMRDFSEYQSSERIGARLAAAFGAFIESPYPEHQMQHPLLAEEGMTLDEIPKYFEAGRIDVLPPGMEIKVAQYNRPGTSYEPFTKTSLKAASAGTNLSYENFSNDYEGATYSSARQAILEERRGYRKMQVFLNRHFNNWIWQEWCLFAEMAGILKNKGKRIPVSWQNPGWSWIDPAKDAKGAKFELDMRINTRKRLAAERGYDWEEDMEDFEEEMKFLEEKGINPKKEEK